MIVVIILNKGVTSDIQDISLLHKEVYDIFIIKCTPSQVGIWATGCIDAWYVLRNQVRVVEACWFTISYGVSLHIEHVSGVAQSISHFLFLLLLFLLLQDTTGMCLLLNLLQGALQSGKLRVEHSCGRVVSRVSRKKLNRLLDIAKVLLHSHI